MYITRCIHGDLIILLDFHHWLFWGFGFLLISMKFNNLSEQGSVERNKRSLYNNVFSVNHFMYEQRAYKLQNTNAVT